MKLTRDDFLRRLQVLKEDYKRARNHALERMREQTASSYQREYCKGRRMAYIDAIEELDALIQQIKQTEA